jgi:hypothetical protein
MDGPDLSSAIEAMEALEFKPINCRLCWQRRWAGMRLTSQKLSWAISNDLWKALLLIELGKTFGIFSYLTFSFQGTQCFVPCLRALASLFLAGIEAAVHTRSSRHGEDLLKKQKCTSSH